MSLKKQEMEEHTAEQSQSYEGVQLSSEFLKIEKEAL